MASSSNKKSSLSNIEKLIESQKTSPIVQFQKKAGIPVGYKRSSGGGGGSSSQPKSTLTTPTPSASDLKGTASEKQKQIEAFQQQQKAIQQQRERAIEQRKVIEQQRQYAQKLREMSYAQRQQFFKEQNRLAEIERLRRLQEQGKKLNQEAKRKLQEQEKREKEAERKQFVTNYLNTQIESKQSKADLRPNFVKTIENSKFYKKYKNTYGGQALQGLIIDIPTALLNSTNKSINFINKSIKDPKLRLKQSKDISKKAFEVVKSQINKAKDIEDLKKRSKKAFLGSLNTVIKAPKKTAKFTGDVVSAMKKEKTFSDRNVLNIGRSFTYTLLDNVTNAPSSIATLIENPKLVTKIIPATIEAGRKNISLLKTSPSEAIGKIGADYYTLKLTNKGLKLTGKVSSKAYNKLNPYISKFEKNKLEINVPKQTFKNKGKPVYLKIRSTGTQVKPGKIPFVSPTKSVFYKKGAFIKFQKTPGITLKSVKRIPTESLRKQASLSGKRVLGVSAQANRLVNLLKTKQVIQKPLGAVENKLSSRGKSLLKKLDAGTITEKELITLDNLVKKTGSKGILERSFFADPRGRVRLSRLGLEEIKEGSLYDLLRGKVSFKKAKPEIYVFENTLVEKFPSYLKNVQKKLKQGKPLTEAESQRFLAWQNTRTGKFKPVGFQTMESEITLAPGEIIKRGKKLTTIVNNGKRIKIVTAKPVKLTKITRKLVDKFKDKKITTTEKIKLKRRLKKETGIDYDLSYKIKPKKYFPIKRRVLSSSLGRLYKVTGREKRYKTPKNIKYRPPKKTKYSPPKKASIKKTPLSKYNKTPTTTYKKTPTTSYKKTPYFNLSKTPPTTTKTNFRINQKKIKSKESSGSIPVFNVYGKSGKKFVKLNNKPLTRNDALSKGAYAIDNTTSKSFKIKPAGKDKKPGTLRKGEYNYFNRAGYKLREFRVSKGRAFKINPKYIERTKYGIDTKGEKKGLSIAKYLKQQKSPSKRLKTQNRRVLLERLKKARAVRMKNLRNKR